MTKELLQQCLDALAPHGSSYANGRRTAEDEAITAIEQSLAQQEQPSKTERQIRRMFCVTYASDSSPYLDDGEAQDNSMFPCIDFLRDSPEQIQSKMVERAIAKHKAQQEQPAQEPVVVQKRVCYESGDYSAWVEIPMSEADNQYRDCVEIRKLYTHPAPTQPALKGKMQQEQSASVDAYNGAREDAAIWKKRALEAEELNRKFIAELNGPTYLGEPVKQEQPAAVAYELEAVKFANGKKLVYQKPENLASYIKVRTLVYADADPAPTQPAFTQEQPAQKPDLWKTQFLTDVMTSAGLLMYGRTDKKLAQRIADGSARWRTELYASAPTQPAQEPVAWLHGTTFQVVVSKNRPDSFSAWLPLFAAPPTQPALRESDVWRSDAIMSVNAELGLSMDQLMRLAKAVEAHCRGGQA